MHPVRQLQRGLPAQRDPVALYDDEQLAGAPDGFPIGAARRARAPRRALHAAGVRRGLHRLRAVRRGLPGPRRTEPAAQAINIAPREPLLERERERIAFFETLPQNERPRVDFCSVRGVQYLQPLFEFSGACAGCGETPYLKLLSQLFGDRLLVANATGCSSIYGGNLPTTPWTRGADGPRPGVGELALRGQRRVRPRLPRWPPTPTARSPARASPSCATRSAPSWSTRSWTRRS